MDHIEFTGERYIPGTHGNIELEHLHRYYLACELASGKVILDIACGEGYGSALLAENATQVIGVDISDIIIAHANERYKKGNLDFKVGTCTSIPLADSSVDLVVSFETIEHLDQHDRMMGEIKRVLRPNGILLISSPDKNNYSLDRGYVNPFHVKELLFQEFIQLLEKYFKNVELLGQKVLYGSHIIPDHLPALTKSYIQEGQSLQSILGISKPLYWLAMASDIQLPELPASIYEQPIDDSEFAKAWKKLTGEQEREIYNLNGQVSELKNKVNQLDDEIILYVNSRSWRWTRIFRQFSRVISKVTGRS